MASRRVLILNIHSLLVGGVESLLETEKDLRVISSNFDSQLALIHEIGRLKPDVVILDETNSTVNPFHLFAMLQDIKKLRLIILNSQTSKMGIYDKDVVTAAQSHDLLAAIRDPNMQPI